ncbi:MAG: DUF4980 domain-containing protein [Bacteroidaceae bacterium]|nr:DUF4980 domain-containing protein [Bacteroidaceae bacterium]MBQ9285957.1 DUF4980 domain-containing protein [Bacteroidaceae bacterium]
MKRILTVMSLMAALAVAGASASMAQDVQGKPLHADQLANDNWLLRVAPTETSKYLLLPVEEKAPEARLKLIVDGQLRRNIDVRMALHKIDYFVPLMLDEFRGHDLVMQVHMNIDRSNRGGTASEICWQNIRLSDEFNMTNRERFRPLYHHTPVYGWMNDPNGMFYKDGVWHLFYQYNPYGAMWGNMNWRHSTSRDLLHWQDEGVAISPDAHGAIFSGSCVVDEKNTAGFGAGAVIALYTSAGDVQSQSLAYSTDGGRTFTPYAGNPILTADVPDFRDPNMFWNEDINAWNLILAVGQEMRIYSSPNLREWKEESRFGLGYGSHDGVWECPDLFKVKNERMKSEKWVLVCNINPGGPFGGSATQYFVGDFDGHKFTCNSDPQVTKWMDWGKDHYATVSFWGAPQGRRTVLAWMSNWQYANDVPTRQFRSANSIARDLGLFNDGSEWYVSVKPAPEMLAARGKRLKNPAEACEIVVELKASATITLANAKGEKVLMTYDDDARIFSMDRTGSGEVGFSEAFPCTTKAPTHGRLRQLRIFVDRSSIEAFDAEGRFAMTNLVFPSEPYNSLKVKGGKATIYDLID